MPLRRQPAPPRAPDWTTGTALPPLVVVPTRAHLFMFSAATWNRHHVHYDQEAAVREGLPGVVVHRGLVGNYLARLLAEWMGDNGCSIEALSWKMLRSAVPGAALTCRGQVAALESGKRDEVVTCELEVVDEAEGVIASGRATLRRARSAE